MNSFHIKFFSLSGCVLLWLLASQPSAAQIVPDTTLPINSTVTTQGNIRQIDSGSRRGDNLFHSFREFSISGGETAFFNNDLTVRNIITRVTGGSSSNIDGVLRANGTANLFFINPNGIVFGPNASLNIGGSFVASTANSIKFADGTEFSAITPQTTPLLTVSVPLGLQFGSTGGKIVNQSLIQNGELTDAEPPNPIGLKVPVGKTLALVGGSVALEGGNLTTTGGRIELGSVGTGLVKLTEIEKGYALDYNAGIQNFEDIQISKSAIVYGSGSGGGDIQLRGRNVILTDGSQVFSSILGTGTGGNVVVKANKLTVEGGATIATFTRGGGQAGNVLVRASDSVELTGTTADASYPSSLTAQVTQEATGKGGNLTIETGQLTIRDGAIVDASTFGVGQAGNVRIKASNIELKGFATTPNRILSSGIFAQVAENAIDNVGDAGTLTIETKQLTVFGGAQISTAARKTGNGGNLTINASDSIQLSGTAPPATAQLLDIYRSGIFVSAESKSRGNVGNLNLTTGLLSVESGARISADNEGTGQGGTANLNVRQLVIRNGGEVRAGSFAEGPGGTLTVNATDSVQVIGTGTIASTPVKSTLFAQALASGKAGDLNITTPSLKVQDGAEVTVSGKGSGSAGDLTITANELRLDRGSLTATTNAGEGANIRLQNLDLLLMQNQSLISAQAYNNANGGTINIDAAKGFVVAVGQNNQILAKAFQGRGGRIDIKNLGIFGIAAEGKQTPGNTNIINASSDFGLAGTVTINTPDVDPVRGLVVLPTGIVDVSRQIAAGCAAFADKGGSSFTITGRGGLPPSPTEPLTNDVVWTDARLPVITVQPSAFKPAAKPHPKPKAEPIAIVPATGWVFNKDKGEVTLISSTPSANSLGTTPATCPSGSGK